MTARVLAVAVVLWLAGAWGALPAAASMQPGPVPAAQAAGQESADQFVPATSLPQQEKLPAAPLLMTAYAFVWAVLLVYVWTIWRRVVKVERELRDLAARIGEKSAGH